MLVDDYKAKYLPEAEVQSVASDWRKLLNQHLLSNCLDIPALAEAAGIQMGSPIKVEPRPDRTMGRANAFVSKGGSTLYIRESLIDDAAKGDPEAVFDGIHELGHIILHRNVQAPLARMATRDNQAKFLQPEESAEHQANVFARTFLMTDDEIALYPTPDLLAENCFVPVEQANLRIKEYGRTTGRRLRNQNRDAARASLAEAQLKGYTARPCPECRNLTLHRSGSHLMCDSCGAIVY